MEYTKNFLKEAHGYCSNNKEAILKSGKIGCFYCENFIKLNDIWEWIDHGKTALCPICGIDSVVGDASGVEITPEFLREMFDLWFEVRRPLK